ncbi:adenylosuccinate synthetase [Candidatus Pacearchaeota archaeon]|nr:adenylosuccinate synthetase [Candidatus Pacearchaeota archaeon]
MQKGKFNIIIGAQSGSESKGKLSAFLVEKFKVKHLVMAASPNASHTAYDWSGKKYVSHHIPIGAVFSQDCAIYFGPSSVIIPEMFLQELTDLEIDQARVSRVFIHPRATIVTHAHIMAEIVAEMAIPNQGVDAARASKLMRRDSVIFAESIPSLQPMIDDTTWMINDLLQRGVTILCEMTQGFDLDLEHGIDPHFCTSKMINPAMAMAEAGVSPKWLGDVYGVLRPFPVRNRDESTYLYAEAKPLTWDLVALQCHAPARYKPGTVLRDDWAEKADTTQRVFEFSWQRFEQFCQICQPNFLCLQFANHLHWEDYGRSGNYMGLSNITRSFIGELEDKSKAKVAYVGTGPEHGQMIDIVG